MAINLDKSKYFGKLFYHKLTSKATIDTEVVSNEMCLVLYVAETRGYKWQIIPDTYIVEISNGIKNVYFDHRSIPTQTILSERICFDKYSTKIFLQKANLCTPKGYVVDGSSSEDELTYVFNKLRKPLVVKPLFGSEGNGVRMNIQDLLAYFEAVDFAKSFNLSDIHKDGVIVEEQVTIGEEYRLFVLDGVLLSCLRKTPCFVTGDGEHSIEELIAIENKDPFRLLDKDLYPQITIDNLMKLKLAENNVTIHSVPAKGCRVQLRDVSNIMAGGYAENIPEAITPQLLQLTKKISQAIPGLKCCSIDILIDNLYDLHEYSVIEINSNPAYTMNELPQIGEGAQIADAILDYVFS